MTKRLDLTPRKRRAARALVSKEMLAAALGLAPDVSIADIRATDDSSGFVFILEGVELPLVRPGDALLRVHIALDAPAQCRVEP